MALTKPTTLQVVICIPVVLLVIGIILPAISMVHESHYTLGNIGSSMRQVMLAAASYASDDAAAQNKQFGRFPQDLKSLVEWSDGELSPKLFTAPGHPEIEEPFVYVRPVARTKAAMPVIVADPACSKKNGSVIVFADGHVGFIEGDAVWQEAKRLAKLPKATVPDGGIEASDWTTVPDLARQ